MFKKFRRDLRLSLRQAAAPAELLAGRPRGDDRSISLLRLLPADSALNFADRAARRIGPWVGRHHVALDNLRKAYPEKSEAEIEAIASDMWGNMARLAAEYIFLDAAVRLRPGCHASLAASRSGE